MTLGRVRIVLVEPAGPLNVGSVARVMKNFGMGQLWLVNPQCDPLGAEARQMAVHGAEVLEQAQIVQTLAQALEGCTRSIATSGRDRLVPLPLGTPRQMLSWLWEPPVQPVALIFGREDAGLTNDELHYAQRLIQIPSCDTYLSLNLAQAVAVCCYELRCYELDPPPLVSASSPQIGIHPPQGVLSGATVSPNESPPGTDGSADDAPPTLAVDSSPLASLADLDRYYGQLEALLLDIGFLYPHTARRRMEKFRRLYNRAQLSHPELSMLYGVIRQTYWAVGSQKHPPPSPPS
ncbi:MAG: RNA methyltransferase [Prochlorothrix sp.]|nr:RNA methyltransferase [Prochlorothrix sp.]